MSKKILILPGDGIGPEIMEQAVAVLNYLNQADNLGLELEQALVGGAAIDATGGPLPTETLAMAKAADAILFGAIGGPQWESLDMAIRPEKGLLGLRSNLELFGNLRPAILYPQLVEASSLKPDLVSGLDIVIVRELTGGIYFGQPRGIRTLENGERQGFNTYVYSESEIKRIEVTELWREVITDLGKEYPEVELSHMYVDNAAMQLIRAPKQFDVIVTGNMFGDILSDAAAMLTGSIGMLPSASLDQNSKGMYEPCHGSAPDIAGKGLANPLATLLSAAMMLRYSLNLDAAAVRIEQAVNTVLEQGYRTADIATGTDQKVSTAEMGAAVLNALNAQN